MISPEIVEFINQTEEIFNYSNVENIQAIYHYSIPNVKLSYPEPFIASASFMHSDLWFVHILVYQYWLWFVFVFIIVFFFITFISTVRWCNMRVKPRRETRGVSRSKCGDLITACVPVSWATSIIVNESTDAIDYYDGFGTTELVIGIRAYQWGWEYYYPKDIDLNYNIKKNYSTFLGNSLKYNKSSDIGISNNNLWKFYQNKTSDHVVTPAYLFVLPVDNNKILNHLAFSDSGVNSIYESNAFKKIKQISKSCSKNLFNSEIFLNSLNNNLFFYYNSVADVNSAGSNGLRKQQNFLSNTALLGSNASLFNKTSVNKIAHFNFKNKFMKPEHFNVFSFFNKMNLSFLENANSGVNCKTFSVLNKNFYLKNYFETPQFYAFKNFFKNTKVASNGGENLAKSYTRFNLKNAKLVTKVIPAQLNLNLFSDLTSVYSNDLTKTPFTNTSKKNYEIAVSSNNETIMSSDRSVRNFLSTGALSKMANFNFFSDLPLDSSNKDQSARVSTNELNYFFLASTPAEWLNPFSKISISRVSLDYPHSPLVANNAATSVLNYDSFVNTFIDNTPTLLQSKEELIPTALSSIYWTFYWSNIDPNWRFFNNFRLSQTNKTFYLPIFNFYYDYDFRNWQALELLENSYWETSCPLFVTDEYALLSKDFYNTEYVDRTFHNFLIKNKNLHFKNSRISDSLLRDTNNTGDAYMTSFYTDDLLSSTNILKTKDFYLFPQIANFFSSEESYDNLKFLFFIFFQNNLNVNPFIFNYLKPLSYSAVFDSFRSDFDEFSWHADDASLSPARSRFFTSSFKPLLTILNNSEIFDISIYANERFSNIINLRNTVKNASVTHNAIQKVFKTRFDENRSHTKLNDFSGSFTPHPFVTSSRINYEQLLKKNKESFFKINFYKFDFKNFNNMLNVSKDGLNFYFFDFPFLLSLKSDSSRYIWFDWYAKWGFYEVQPSSSSRFSIAGVPYFSKNFEFNASSNDAFGETETYLTRIAKARKNYLPNWSYTPYFYVKNNFWYKNNYFFDYGQNEKSLLTGTKFFFFNMGWYWTGDSFLNFNSDRFTPSNSNTKTYSKTAWQPASGTASYFNCVSGLIDILTKREYLYREFLIKNYKLINLPSDLSATGANPLIQEIKTNFFYFNNLTLSNEYSRSLFFTSVEHFNHTSSQLFFNELSQILNFNKMFNPILLYFFNFDEKRLKNESLSETVKNQYRPLRKGITNMIRLHATGAMALPIEIRLQILASSKDVIHSWAIPSAGIKIDCVPGYSSHRVMIFLVSGIFWGQCMEICGRYHHWMPIIVYFMKRDLFFLWCTHFIFLTNANTSWSINERQYVDYTRTVSFDKNSWLTEIYQ